MLNLSDITIEYAEVIPEDKQMAEFYINQTEPFVFATITKHAEDPYNVREAYVAVNGEMYISIPREPWAGYDKEYTEEVIRYSDDLEMFVKTDKELLDLLHLWSVEREYEIYHMNPWWEVYSDDYPDGEVFDTFYEAVEGAIKFVQDDEYWEQY
jgi:hypothetical protein